MMSVRERSVKYYPDKNGEIKFPHNVLLTIWPYIDFRYELQLITPMTTHTHTNFEYFILLRYIDHKVKKV